MTHTPGVCFCTAVAAYNNSNAYHNNNAYIYICYSTFLQYLYLIAAHIQYMYQSCSVEICPHNWLIVLLFNSRESEALQYRYIHFRTDHRQGLRSNVGYCTMIYAESPLAINVWADTGVHIQRARLYMHKRVAHYQKTFVRRRPLPNIISFASFTLVARKLLPPESGWFAIMILRWASLTLSSAADSRRPRMRAASRLVISAWKPPCMTSDHHSQ